MKELSQYITEALGSGFTMKCDTPEEAYDVFNKIKYIIDIDFINDIYNLWNYKFQNRPECTPFRFSNTACKLARCYFDNAYDELLNICNKYNYDIARNRDGLYSINVNRRSIKEGDGSLKGVHAAKGLSYEQTVIDEVIDLIKNEKDSYAYNHLKELYDSGDLNNIINKYKQDASLDLTSLVVATGASNTQRNSHNEIFDKNTFEINTSNQHNVLKNSGSIISDITVDRDINISVKMKKAQLSGIAIQNVMNHNSVFIKSLSSNASYDSIKDDRDMVPFNNFAEQFGIDPEELYNMYLNKSFGELSVNKYDSKTLGIFIQNLVGGNYWYIKPSECIYVTDKPRNYKVDIERINVSDSGKQISIYIKINNTSGKLNIRTDGYGDYPYRIFPQVNVVDIIR